MAGDDVKYEIKTVTTVRGIGARSIAKWEKEGWEFVSQVEQPMLRTRMTFRRVKPKPPWLLIGSAAGVMVVLGVVITVMSLITGGSDDKASPSATLEASPPAASPSVSPTAAVSAQPSAEPAPAYVYTGPKYEIVSADEDQSAAELTQYWVYTSELDESTPAYKDQVKAIISDVAHVEGTDLLFVEVVTDKEIALAESPSTYERFIEDFGTDYAVNTIPQREKAGWVASYSGGFDVDTGEASGSAFELVFHPAATTEFETWKPESLG